MRAFFLHLAVLAALGASTARASSAVSGAYSLELIDESGRPLPTFWKNGRTYVLGALESRYALHIRNNSSRRVEFVASVDGRDVLDGKSADLEKRGYIVNPFGDVTIDGFRLDNESVAAFRFSRVSDSYAARMGDARDVGVVGVAVFAERAPVYRFAPAESFDNRLSGLAGGSGTIGLDAQPSAAPPEVQASARNDSVREPMAKDRARKSERPGLGTEFGEQRSSHVDQVAFERASTSPAVVLTLRYNDRDGLRALGIDVDRSRYQREANLRESAEPFRASFCEPPPGWAR